MADTPIEWTDKVWNPTRGCSRVSPGCENCYAERQAIRHAGPGGSYEGLARSGKNGPRWTGKVRLIGDKLDEPLRWKKPARIFVNSMSDLFHENLADDAIASVFGVMATCSRHTFQVLTKRADRMRRWFEWVARLQADPWTECHYAALMRDGEDEYLHRHGDDETVRPWPLPNVWLGVSVEDQQRAEERIPHLLATPAAVRFLSVEPLLGRVSLRQWFRQEACNHCSYGVMDATNPHLHGACRCACHPPAAIDWVIVGGESGPGARPCAMEWIESVVEQCSAAGVACFVKQLGAYVVSEERTAPREVFQREDVDLAPNGEAWAWRSGLVDKKGGDPSEWPKELRVRQFPMVRR